MLLEEGTVIRLPPNERDSDCRNGTTNTNDSTLPSTERVEVECCYKYKVFF